MKNHLRMFLAISLSILIFFLLYKNGIPAGRPDKTADLMRVQNLRRHYGRIRREKWKDRLLPNSITSFFGATMRTNVSEKSCWDRIRDQYQVNSSYLTESRLRLDAIVGDWYYTKNNDRINMNIEETSQQGKFFLGLARAGLLEGINMEHDEPLALLLLKQVAEADPLNSAPILYAAVIESRRGNRVQAEELLKEVSRSQYFDSYIKDFIFTLFEGVRTPSDLLAAQEAWSMSPVPDSIALLEILKENKQSGVAFQLVKDGLRDDRERITDFSWSPIEYAVGRKLLKIYGTGVNIPEYNALPSKYPIGLGEDIKEAVTELDSTCNPDSIAQDVEVLRDYFELVRTKGI